jgi:hypothetical protein
LQIARRRRIFQANRKFPDDEGIVVSRLRSRHLKSSSVFLLITPAPLTFVNSHCAQKTFPAFFHHERHSMDATLQKTPQHLGDRISLRGLGL